MDIRWVLYLNNSLATLVFFLIYGFNASFVLIGVHLILQLLLICTFNWDFLNKFLRGFDALIECRSRCDRQRSMPSVDHSLLELALVLVLDVHTTIFNLMASFSPLQSVYISHAKGGADHLRHHVTAGRFSI